MQDNEFNKVGLYKHNATSYKKVKEAYASGEKVVGIVHATGTGKTYNALQLAYDNPDKKIIYVVPNNSVAEHIENIIKNNPNLDRERDFPNLEFKTYQSFVNMSREEIKELECDLLILDEFHHLGAPVWGSRIESIVETHPDMLVFGMTAYTVRDRGTPYERDMANPDTNELFSGKIVSRYDLVDAMLDGVLPRDIIYRTAYTNLLGLEEELEYKIKNMIVTDEELEEYIKVLAIAKKRIAEAPGVAEVIRKYVKPNGKYFYFCPPKSEDGTNDIESIMKEAYEWFKQYVPEEDIEFYVTTSEMKEEGKRNREAFYNDLTLDGKPASGKLRIMFTINQYNEGVHAPNVDGVIMGRGTSSDIIFFEQLGRSLSVRGDTYERYNEYESYTYEELVALAKDKDIIINNDMTKEDIIEKLIAPVIIDLTNNIGFIKELEDNLKARIRERREKGIGTRTVSKLKDVSFDIDVMNEDLYQVLSDLKNKVRRDWNFMYELAKSYYEHNGHLNIPRNFKTKNGYTYDEKGVNLGAWLNNQKYLFISGNLSQERADKLKKIGMFFVDRENSFSKMYRYAEQYYNENGNLNIPDNYILITNSGIAVNLKEWILSQYDDFANGKLNNEKRKKLEQIGFKFNESEKEWTTMYKLAKKYYNRHGNLDIPLNFKTKNGYKYDEDGFPLGELFDKEKNMILRGNLSEEKILKWEELGFSVTAFLGSFDTMCTLAKTYFSIYRHLDVPIDFKTKYGYSYDENGLLLGAWLKIQYLKYKNGRLNKEHKKILEDIGVIFDNSSESWNLMYKKAQAYYRKNNDMIISPYYQTTDGYNLGSWIYYQRHLITLGTLDEDKINKLKAVGVTSGIRTGLDDNDWDLMYELAKKHYNEYGDLQKVNYFKYITSDGIKSSYDGYNLGLWLFNQRMVLYQNKLPKEKVDKLKAIGIVNDDIKLDLQLIANYAYNDWGLMYAFAKDYYNKYGHLLVSEHYVTLIEEEYSEENGFYLGPWLKEQRELFKYGRLSQEQISKLEQIGVILDNEEYTWEYMYNLAKIYHKHHGNVEMRLSFKTKNGYEYDEKGEPLGKWINRQMKLLDEGKLDDSRKTKLELIGINLEQMKEKYFEIMYKKAEGYYNENGHLDISFRYLNEAAIRKLTYEELELSVWIANCEKEARKGNMPKEMYERLERIGMFLPRREVEWNHMYRLATIYFEKYGNINIPDGFKTFNGFEYHEEGYETGKWIKNQELRLKQGKLSEDKINKLSNIGLVANIRTNNYTNKKVCLEYGIDYKKNKAILDRISYIVLVSKINYLLHIGEKITIDGKLHEIFSMSSIDVWLKYKIPLDKLVNEFYMFDNRKKGL